MTGFYGSEFQQRLQQRVAESAAWFASTPGAANCGRAVSCDDVDALGWDTVEAILARDGCCTFRLFTRAEADAIAERVTALGYRIDFWEAYIGSRADVLSATAEILGTGLPEGIREAEPLAGPSDPRVMAIQRLMTESGVAPYGGSMLAGAQEPVVTIALESEDGTLAACAFAHRPHNPMSRWHDHAYAGGVAVDAAFRGRGLGRIANALAVRRVLERLGGTHVYEFVTAGNEPSARMVTASGIRRDGDRLGGIAVANGARFTK